MEVRVLSWALRKYVLECARNHQERDCMASSRKKRLARRKALEDEAKEVLARARRIRQEILGNPKDPAGRVIRAYSLKG